MRRDEFVCKGSVFRVGVSKSSDVDEWASAPRAWSSRCTHSSEILGLTCHGRKVNTEKEIRILDITKISL